MASRQSAIGYMKQPLYQPSSRSEQPSNSLENSSSGDDSGDDSNSDNADNDSPPPPPRARPAMYPGNGNGPLAPQAATSVEASESGDPNQQGGGGPAPDEEEFECPDDGIFADESSGCQSYLVCQSGAQVQQKFQCPLGTLFNNIILTCDFAHNVQCGKGGGGAKAASGSGPQGAPSDPNDTVRHSSAQASATNQYQQPSSLYNRQSQQAQTPQLPRYQQLPQPWQQHYPPSAAQQQQQSQPSALNIRPRQHPLPAAAAPPQSYQNPAPSGDIASDDSDSDGDGPNHNGASGGNSDYDAPEPLIPASLPPQAASRARQHQQHAASSSSILPYKAPPAITPIAQSHRPNLPSLRYQPTPNRDFHSAHRSQLRPSNYQTDPSAANYDGASAVTPVYAEKPVKIQPPPPPPPPPTTTTSATSGSATIRSSGSAAAAAVASVGPEEPSSFNLVINHVTKPTADQHKQHQPTSGQQQNQLTRDASTRKQQQQHSEPNQTPFKPIRAQQLQPIQPPSLPQPKPIHHLHQPTHQRSPPPPQVRQQQPVNHHQQANSYQSASISAAASRPQHMTGAYQSLASQAKPVHVSGQEAFVSQQNRGPRIIDLTSDKQIGVSSEAMNNGLLLIVRHAPQQSHAANPLSSMGSAVASSTMSTTHASPLQAFNPTAFGLNQYDSTGSNNNQAGSGDHQLARAYAIDPILVRPGASIDAQLFPNIQAVLGQQQQQQLHNQQQQQQQRAHSSASSNYEMTQPSLIETTSHLHNSNNDNNDGSQSSERNGIMYTIASSNEPINLMIGSSSVATGSGFETSAANPSPSRVQASSEQMATQSTWMTTTQANPPVIITTASPPTNRQAANLPVATSKRLKAAKAPQKAN